MELEGKIMQSYFFKFSKIRIFFNPTKIFPWKFCKNFVHLEKFAKKYENFLAVAMEAMDDLGMVQQMDDEVDIAMMGEMDEGDGEV